MKKKKEDFLLILDSIDERIEDIRDKLGYVPDDIEDKRRKFVRTRDGNIARDLLIK